ncbi:hypothetical protein BJY04DRAFT_31596 [Aspergillus karnatakaensis]|uniref:uncharacterized protein n=1 Tax=Aspergillus karnatakaensis TaxID=1810916 RepID=UPI003CCE46B5
MRTELVVRTLRLAEYDTTRRRLPVAHDPLHPANAEQLKKYLAYCWSTLVRYNMFARELEMEINWKLETIICLSRIVGVPPGRKLFYKGGLDHRISGCMNFGMRMGRMSMYSPLVFSDLYTM